MADKAFSEQVLAWFDQHGRHDLPWQKNRTLYRVWLAEVMLQQTQVATVMPYYQKFLAAFPELSDLADATQDEVLKLWAGLGYYTRGRNLHKAAVVIKLQYAGIFPEQFDDVLALPGIGRSTAGAILAQSLGQCHAILDGNVKRVLSRYYGIEGWYGKKAVENELWQASEVCTPHHRVADYTQAMMDFGATLCTRSSPDCEQCPLMSTCLALKNQRVNELPTRKPKKQIPVKTVRMLLLTNSKGHILLEKRPPTGIWGGLWSLPELALEDNVAEQCEQRWNSSIESVKDLCAFRHTFSHYHLDITPCRVQIAAISTQVQDSDWQWCTAAQLDDYALATPIANILQQHLK